MYPSFRLTLFAAALAPLLGLSACSRDTPAPANPPASSPAAPAKPTAPGLHDTTSTAIWQDMQKARRSQAAEGMTDRADFATPLSAYRSIDDPAAIAVTAAAVSKAPVPLESLALAVDPRLSFITDAFQKRDAIEAMRPRLTEQQAAAAKNRYLRFRLSAPALGGYDFQRKGFPLNAIGADGWLGFAGSGSRIRYTNGAEFGFLPVADEALARRIEESRRALTALSLDVYLYAMGRDPTEELSVIGQITSVVLRGRDDVELVRLSARR